MSGGHPQNVPLKCSQRVSTMNSGDTAKPISHATSAATASLHAPLRIRYHLAKLESLVLNVTSLLASTRSTFRFPFSSFSPRSTSASDSWYASLSRISAGFHLTSYIASSSIVLPRIASSCSAGVV